MFDACWQYDDGMRPPEPPLGLKLATTARLVSRAFDQALADAGGSLPIWLVLLNLRIRPGASQRELAAAVGVREATLTHHLNGMEQSGLVTRRRDPGNRRTHVVELTSEGQEAFERMRSAAINFDRRLRRGLEKAELGELDRLLGRLVANVRGAA
jgi:MarR family transcriptional regulator for hemolysin